MRSECLSSRLSVVLLVLIAGIGFAVGGAAEEPKPIYGGQLTLASGQSIFNLDLHQDSGTLGVYVLNQIHESLLGIDDEGNLMPVLAESMPEVLDGGMAYIFNLRRGVKFHDGTDFDADAVKYNFDRVLDPERSTLASRLQPFIEGVEVLDRYKIKLNMLQPWADLLIVMANEKSLSMASPTAIEKWGDQYGVKAIVGTGPFKFVEYEEGVRVILERNAEYWQHGLPYLDRLVYLQIPEDATRTLGFRSGEIDVLLDVPTADLSSLAKEPGVLIDKGGGGIVAQVMFNTTQPPFDNVKIRQALSMAIDRDVLVDVAYSGFAEPATSIFPSWNAGYTTGWNPYDPAGARALLAEEGYTAENPLKFNLLIRDEPIWVDTATVLRAMWKDIGVEVTMEPMAAAGLGNLLSTLDPYYKVAVYRLGYSDPVTDYSNRTYVSTSYLNRTGYNRGGYANAHVDELLNKAATVTDPVLADELNEEIAHAIFIEDVPIITLAFLDNTDAIHSYVQNWHQRVLDSMTRKRVWVTPH